MYIMNFQDIYMFNRGVQGNMIQEGSAFSSIKHQEVFSITWRTYLSEGGTKKTWEILEEHGIITLGLGWSCFLMFLIPPTNLWWKKLGNIVI